jgi:stage II sporulation protein D
MPRRFTTSRPLSAARSYAIVHSRGRERAAYDLVSDVSHQVYGGADAERAGTDSAVASTAGRVLLYAGRVVDAPYHAVCGGSTAEATEVWRTTGQPYLRAVSDRIPGSADRYYCDPSPRFAWTRSFTASSLAALLDRYLRSYAPVPSGGVGSVRSLVVSDLTPSGRVRTLDIATDAGRYALRGNDIRFVLRSPGGEILSSTYFSVESSVGRDGRLVQLTLRGTGYGHGIGMCQWGAIGRARAGQDYLAILQTYYPGTRVGPVPPAER